MKKRLSLPWERRCTLTCACCGGKIETLPLWNWEKLEDKVHKLQPMFCHAIDSGLAKQIPVLSENDWHAKQRYDEFIAEFKDRDGKAKPKEAIEPLLIVEKGHVPQIFRKHGIFPLLSFPETELKALFMLLCLNPVSVAKQTFLVQTMRISRAYASTILKKLAKWNLVERGRIRMKGRANGRQLGYFLGKEARERLDKDLLEFDFFRNSVRETVRPIALCFNRLAWRQDLGLLDRET